MQTTAEQVRGVADVCCLLLVIDYQCVPLSDELSIKYPDVSFVQVCSSRQSGAPVFAPLTFTERRVQCSDDSIDRLPYIVQQLTTATRITQHAREKQQDVL